MTRLLSLMRRIGLDDIALLAGVVLLWIGCGMITRWLPYLVIGSLALAFWGVPLAVSVSLRSRRRR